jgi:hypothetical protein
MYASLKHIHHDCLAEQSVICFAETVVRLISFSNLNPNVLFYSLSTDAANG